MIIRLILVAGVVFAALSLMRYINNQPPKQRKKMLIQLGAGAFIVLLLFAAVTGRMHWAGALVAAIIPFLGRLIPFAIRLLPLIQFWRQQKKSTVSGGKTSTVSTDILHMQLDHDSGEMHGEVLQGPQKGKQLGQLDEQQLRDLLIYCNDKDQESEQLLCAYLQRRFGEEWFNESGFADAAQDYSQQGGSQRQDPPQNADMSDKEARQILGLDEDAAQEDIIQAHRKLMQKLHPDRGGSDYLAAKVNQAKAVLLNR